MNIHQGVPNCQNEYLLSVRDTKSLIIVIQWNLPYPDSQVTGTSIIQAAK